MLRTNRLHLPFELSYLRFKIVPTYPTVLVSLVGLKALPLNCTYLNSQMNLRQTVNALLLVASVIDTSVRNEIELVISPIRPALPPFNQKFLVIPCWFLLRETIFVNFSGGKQNMNVRIAVAFVVDSEIAAHSYAHKTLLAELSDQINLIVS